MNPSNPVKQTLDKLNEHFKAQMNELIALHAKSTQDVIKSFADRGISIND